MADDLDVCGGIFDERVTGKRVRIGSRSGIGVDIKCLAASLQAFSDFSKSTEFVSNA